MKHNSNHGERQWLTPLILVTVKVAAQLIFLQRYGIHRDELYFLECGRQLSLGYVDHAPFTAWVAALSQLPGTGLFFLRLPVVFAAAVAMLLTLAIVRRMGGGSYAQWVSGLGFLLAPAYLRMHGMLHLPAFELLFWTLNAYVLVRLLQPLDRGSAGLWWLLGLSTGLGLLNKHTMLVWGLAFVVALVVAGPRNFFREWRLWAAGGVALGLFGFNLFWQMQNDWPTLEFVRGMGRRFEYTMPRLLFVLGQVLYLGPGALVVWGAGLVALLVGPLRRYRLLGVIYVVSFLVFLTTRGKPYYLAAAYPVLFAAGGVFWEARLGTRGGGRRGALLIVSMLLLGGVTLPPALPVLSMGATDRYVSRLLGAVIRPRDLTHDLHDMFGWEEQARTAERIVRRLRGAGERPAVLVANYGQASAYNHFRTDTTSRAYSGHMNYYLWGPPPLEANVFVAYGFSRSFLETRFALVNQVALSDHPLASRWERRLPVFVVREPRIHPAREWQRYKRYGFGGSQTIAADRKRALRRAVQP